MCKCPICNNNLAKIVYGLPGPELAQKARNKEIFLAGCIMDSKGLPEYHCYNCNKNFYDFETKKPIKEEDIIKHCENDFQYQIKKRGEAYHNQGNIIYCKKSGNKYYAKVDGSDIEPYNVEVTVDNYIDYNCDCPCDFPCKHEYAVLLAISNKEYETTKLKEKIDKKTYVIEEILKQIPAQDIKDYLLSEEAKNAVYFNTNTFEKHFIKYLPKQSYEYYYNNLYNSLIINQKDLLQDYYEQIKEYISNNEFQESFKIIKSIIEAYKDNNMLNNDFINEFPTIGMFLRVTYRKADNNLMGTINDWLLKLHSNNYYDNYYLEDIVLNTFAVEKNKDIELLNIKTNN